MSFRPTGISRKVTRSFTNKMQNENLARPPLPGKIGLKDTTKKVFGLKRKAENYIENKGTKKRSAFGDITNAIEKTLNNKKDSKKVPLARKPLSSVNSNSVLKPVKGLIGLTKKSPVKKELLNSIVVIKQISVPKDEIKEESFNDTIVLSSQELQANKIQLEESAEYLSASEATPVSKLIEEKPTIKCDSNVPEGIKDIDHENRDDPYSVSCYAKNIFKYYKEREAVFTVDKYIKRQSDVTKSMRAILVDWMVEVQESFELNHETLYLAVKLVDLYLSKVIICRDKLQLVGSTAIFIACKFDERTPPYIDDFLYICDDAYKRRELILLEIKMLKALEFDLGIPLSYRYLRRYARCDSVSMEDLTFARYILETSLMEYELIDATDSMVAAAALFLSLRIKGTSEWTPTLKFYSGYPMEDIYHMVQTLHQMLLQPTKDHLKTIRNKYAHKVFFEVAKIPIPESLDL